PHLLVPFPHLFCTECKVPPRPRWKKSARQCFHCRKDKPDAEQIEAILERARRGLGSCSICYGPEDRGSNRLCRARYTQQVGKGARHK
ncbi:hypothetical protein B0T20DRAFT_320518, partial [Sordaria brevicollis]